MNPQTANNIISTLILILSFWIVRWMTVNALTRWRPPNADIRRKWIFQIKNFLFVFLIIGVVVIWATELRTFAFSLVAVAAAIVIATKELILCFLGGVLRGSTRPFDLGDRIQVGQFHGDVIDHSFFTTTLLEIGPGLDLHQYTGRSIEIPNCLFLTTPILNETSAQKYVLHTFRLPFPREGQWQKAESKLLEAANEECAPYLEEARITMDQMSHIKGIEPPNPDPRVTLHFPDPNRVDLVVRMPVPSQRKGRLEQAVFKRFFSKLESQQK